MPEFYGNSDKFYGYDPSKDTTESPSTIWVYTPSQKKLLAPGSLKVGR
ncbi:hypothetical membrane protein [Cutibacterium acnes JCM 18918]|nr:hypothetical membrane protein [Cutibacterium acnes JCM 18918]